MKHNNMISQNTPGILIVDDVHANLKILGDILEDQGYRVRPVTNGKLALQVAEKEKPDLILLDIMMPDMDGFEVCRQFKGNQKLSDIPVIFVSALTDTNDIVKALNSGGVDYIAKPFQSEEVIARVSIHLQLYRQKKELLEQRNELQKLNTERDKFFSIIAHDLRGPFNGFLGLTELLVHDLPTLSMGEIQKIAFSMRNSAANVFQFLENLLEWGRMQRELILFKPEWDKLLPAANESIALMIEPAANKEIEIACLVPATLEVFADAHLLKTVLRNLVSNAVKFTPKGGQVTLSARVTDDKVIEISVKDTGIGISSAMVNDLFRLDIITARRGTEDEASTGLGLIICKDFVEKLGGKLWVESQERKGSTFYFTVEGSDGSN